jgi:hypothetical protein
MLFVAIIYLCLLCHIQILLGLCFQTVNKITVLYRMTKESPYQHLIYHVDLYVHTVPMLYSETQKWSSLSDDQTVFNIRLYKYIYYNFMLCIPCRFSAYIYCYYISTTLITVSVSKCCLRQMRFDIYTGNIFSAGFTDLSCVCLGLHISLY